MRRSFVKTLIAEAKLDSRITLITGDLGFGVLEEFQNQLPQQFINSGINEQSMMGMAGGIASTGRRVFVYSIGNFSTMRCLEQIRNDVCLMNNSVVVVSVGAGYSYGSQGYTHHALEDIAVMRALPNMDVVIPSDPLEAVAITKFVARRNQPTYLRLEKNSQEMINTSDPVIAHGKFHEIKSGSDGTILFSGSVGRLALEASTELRKHNISVAVASVIFISNIDVEYLKSASLKGPIVFIEEHSYRGGAASAILEALNSNRIMAKLQIVASNQQNLAQIGDQNYLREQNGISVSEIIRKFMLLLED
jgi:transketolase